MRSLDHVRRTEDCPLCGLPKSVCRDPKNERRFSAEAERCFASAAVHREQAKHQAEKMPDLGSLSYGASLGS